MSNTQRYPLLSTQSPASVVMIRPHHFHPNPETADDNVFQQAEVVGSRQETSAKAYQEVTDAADTLRANGVTVHLFEDESQRTPDSVFPNNWFSTHAGGHVAVYPMYSRNRRLERRSDVLDMLKTEYRVQDTIDYSGLEPDGLFLEGTGSMVLDHIDRVAYTARSNRANAIALERFCTHFNFEPMAFDSADENGVPIYHTNVLMSIAERYVLIGSELISEPPRRAEVLQRFEATGREIIELSNDQVRSFAANALELATPDGKVLAMSATAYEAITPAQRNQIEQYAKIVALSVPTIEQAGGSVRCMLAGIHLTRR